MTTCWLPLAAVFSVNLDVILSAKPTFRFDPKDLWPKKPIISRDPMKLECFIKSDLTFTMSWTKDPPPIRNSSKIKNTDVSDTGSYSCRATNSDGYVEHTGYVKVTDGRTSAPVVIATSPPGGVAEVPLGTSVNISCTFFTGDDCFEMEMLWLRDGVEVNETDRITYIPTDGCVDGRQTLALSITNVKLTDLGTYQCYSSTWQGSDKRNITLLRSKPSDQSPNWQIVITISAAAAGLVLGIILIGVVWTRKRKSGKYDLLDWQQPDLRHFDRKCRKLLIKVVHNEMLTVPDHEIVYEAFISYSSDDEDWVKPVLFQTLREDGYNICIHFKDFIPGMTISENIMDAIYKSKKTIIVMSEYFLKSVWGQFELQQALNKAVSKREDVIILVKIDNCKVPASLMGKTFLDWTDEKVKPHFWQRLKDAIGKPGQLRNPNPMEEEDTDQDEPIENPDENNEPVDETNAVIGPPVIQVNINEDEPIENPNRKDQRVDETNDVIGPHVITIDGNHFANKRTNLGHIYPVPAGVVQGNPVLPIRNCHMQ